MLYHWVLLVYFFHCVCSNFSAWSSVVALGANLICNKIPGLAPRQRTLCQSRPDAIVAVGEGAKLGLAECRYQFRYNRWNCNAMDWDINGVAHQAGNIPPSREAAFTNAINSAGVAFAITQACSQGNLSSCGCDRSKLRAEDFAAGGWKWGGCSADIKYGLTFSRIFVDARELDENERALMNLHNNRAGRKAMKDNMRNQCKCHGVSGSCTMRTCWTILPNFREIGNSLMKRYVIAKEVVPIKGRRARKAVFLKLKRSPRPHKKPRRHDLVFLDKSPNYCETNSRLGTIGTSGRRCNKTDPGSAGCDILCCGRGYNTHKYVKEEQCNCKFHWCCTVTCDYCIRHIEEHTCK